MHHHLEIVMPPTDRIEDAVGSVMARFDENGKDTHRAFWDWWVIGGRWAGTKRMARYDKEKLDAFDKWGLEEGLTVSGFQAGKPELNPKSQIAKVDAKWQEMFPSDPPIPCPLFAHSNNQYDHGAGGRLPEDVALLRDVSRTLTMSRVIIAGPKSYLEEGETPGPEATFMLVDEEWNGTNHMKVAWDGTLGGALDAFKKHIEHYRPEYAETITPKDDWLVVTVDYHS
jgi:hypothetical protein